MHLIFYSYKNVLKQICLQKKLKRWRDWCINECRHKFILWHLKLRNFHKILFFHTFLHAISFIYFESFRVHYVVLLSVLYCHGKKYHFETAVAGCQVFVYCSRSLSILFFFFSYFVSTRILNKIYNNFSESISQNENSKLQNKIM